MIQTTAPIGGVDDPFIGKVDQRRYAIYAIFNTLYQLYLYIN